jgi:23S rRNA (uracil1939-C5)-methyltransferase
MEKILKIEKMVHKGFGMAHIDEGTAFIAGVISGETVKARIIKKNSKIFYAEVLKILEPSPFRRNPICPFYSICGGCNWMHIDYERQIFFKKEIFLECLARIGKISQIPSVITFSSKEFNYRRRVQIKIDYHKKTAGFYKKNTNEIVSVTSCPILCEPLNDFLSQIPNYLSFLPYSIKQIKAIYGGAFLNSKKDFSPIASFPQVSGLSCDETIIDVDSRIFYVRGNSFFQSNIFLCNKIALCALDWIKGESFCDLYSGLGFFSAFAYKNFCKGYAVDNQEEHIILAKKNFEANKIYNVAPVVKSSDIFLSDLINKKEKIDCIIVDPPRNGLTKKVRHFISVLSPNSILYVSCEPATMSRDIGFFVNLNGYKIVKSALFDFYPQTHHIECALLLYKE